MPLTLLSGESVTQGLAVDLLFSGIPVAAVIADTVIISALLTALMALRLAGAEYPEWWSCWIEYERKLLKRSPPGKGEETQAVACRREK